MGEVGDGGRVPSCAKGGREREEKEKEKEKKKESQWGEGGVGKKGGNGGGGGGSRSLSVLSRNTVIGGKKNAQKMGWGEMGLHPLLVTKK